MRPAADVGSPEFLATRGIVLVRAARVYDVLEPATLFWRDQALVQATAAALAPRDGERILDVGCATGALAAAVARRMRNGCVIGIDASGPMIAVARRRRGGRLCRFRMALAEDLPFADASFDAVGSVMFFHHVPLDLKHRAAGEMLRVLRPGGRVAVADLDVPWSRFGRLYGGVAWRLLRQPEIKENLDGALPRVLRGAGLRDLAPGFGTLGCVRLWTGRKEAWTDASTA